jgi:hypothetical protein
MQARPALTPTTHNPQPSTHPTHKTPHTPNTHDTPHGQCLSNDGDVKLYICSTRQLLVGGSYAVVNKLEPCPVSRHVSGRPHHQAIAHAFRQRGMGMEGGEGGAGGCSGGEEVAAGIVLTRAPQVGTLPPGKGGLPLQGVCVIVRGWGLG